MGIRTIICLLFGVALAACGGEGDFSPSGNMNAPRHGHTATKLETGEILIAAGLTKTSPLDDFEIYDPARGTFKPHKIQGLRARGWHKAILLGGAVLITGGWTNGGEALRDSFLIQPGGGVRARAMMKYGRYDHTMTKLPAGDVLIAGGNDGKRAIRHLEIYAPGKKRFLPARRPMLMARQQHSATALSGRQHPHPGRRGRKGGALRGALPALSGKNASGSKPDDAKEPPQRYTASGREGAHRRRSGQGKNARQR